MKSYSGRHIVAKALLLVVSLWMLGGSALAQTTTGSIYGTVTDSSGAVIPKAPVIVTNVRTGESHTIPSNGTGEYVFPVLDPGDYQLTVQLSGFQSQTQTGVRLDANQNIHVNFSLHPGDISQNVSVEAGTTLIDTRESQVGQTIDQKQIEDLPLNGRLATSLVQLVPGITQYVADQTTGSRNGSSFAANGIGYGNSLYLDGAYDVALYTQAFNLLPNPDALQEFRVLTSNFDAEFGRTPGAVVNAITRSGSNQFHGTAYDYLRNTALNAKDYFTTSVTPLHQNQFGGNFGGPIYRNKAFFFGDYQGLIVHTPYTVASASIITPTAQEAVGNFSAQPMAQWPKMSNGQYYSCNGVQGVICSNLLDPVAQNALAFVPLSNPATGHPAQQNANANISSNQELARVDYQITDKHKLSAMYFMSRGTQNVPNIGQILDYDGAVDYNGQYNAVVSDTWLISPSKLNDLRLTYSLDHYNQSDASFGTQHLLSNLGSQAAEGGPVSNPPSFAITGYWQEGAPTVVLHDTQLTMGVVDTFNWSLKNHEIKAGGSFFWNRFANDGSTSSNGNFTFSGAITGNAMADFLLGRAASLTQSSDNINRSHDPDPSLFFQDNWRFTPKLTLDIGLRWEAFLPYLAAKESTFVPNQQSTVFPSAPLGLVTEGDAGVPNGLIKTSWDSFAPRLGFAYDVFGDGRTAVRGAFGIFYNPAVPVSALNAYVQQPYSRSVTVANTPNLVTPFAPAADPFPYVASAQNAVFLSGTLIRSFAPNMSTAGYAQEYNLAVQQGFGVNWSAQLAYVGNTIRRFATFSDINSPIYAPGGLTTTAGLNARRPYEPTPTSYTFGAIDQYSPEANGSYNSLQATLTKKLAHRFSLSASYVWSKSIGIEYGVSNNTGLADEHNFTSSRGLNPWDTRNRFVASYIWVSPDIHHLGFVGKEVLSGWQLNGITTLSTGYPFNVLSGKDTNLDGYATDHPNEVGNPNISAGRSRASRIAQYFNTSAFQQLPAGVPYGNIPYDSQIGPGYMNTDFSAFKNFPIYKGTLQFRGELFNLFNYVNLSNPNATETSPSFGKISGDVSPRIVQFALRYSF